MSNIWLSLKDLVTTYVFGGDLTTAGQWGELCADLVSTCGTLFVIAIPFLAVIFVAKIIIGR